MMSYFPLVPESVNGTSWNIFDGCGSEGCPAKHGWLLAIVISGNCPILADTVAHRPEPKPVASRKMDGAKFANIVLILVLPPQSFCAISLPFCIVRGAIS